MQFWIFIVYYGIFTAIILQTADSESDESECKCDSTSDTTPIIIGVIIAVVGVVFGTVGISIAIYVVVKNRYVYIASGTHEGRAFGPHGLLIAYSYTYFID